jgi:enoyl-CoA hydratase
MSYAELESLLNLVGRAVTLEILLEGRIFGAEEAREKGLVQRVVPDDKVEEEALATAQRIVDGAPLVARWHKKFIDRLSDPALLSKDEIDEGFLCFGTRDFEIGLKAFLEKKKPDFTGR